MSSLNGYSHFANRRDYTKLSYLIKGLYFDVLLCCF